MHLPEFTAEASLDTAKKHYRLSFFPTSIADGNKVVPAQWRYNLHPEGIVCHCYGGYCYCHGLIAPLIPPKGILNAP